MGSVSCRAATRFKTYLQGLQQRLGVAAALIKGPDLLMLDEPTNGLDPELEIRLSLAATEPYNLAMP